MKLVNITYSDSINGLIQGSDIVCSVGELKTMIADYEVGNNLCLEDVIVKYNPALSLETVRKPTNEYGWQIMCTGLILGVQYDMKLIVDSQNSENYYKNKNITVKFTKVSDTEFTITTSFYIISDTNGYIMESDNVFNKWYNVPSVDTNPNQDYNNINSMYTTQSYFCKYLEVVDVQTGIKDSLLDYQPIQARYYENTQTTPLINTISLSTQTFTIDTPNTVTVQFTNSSGMTPTSAKLMLVNKTSENNLTEVTNTIIEDDQIGGLLSLGAGVYSVTGILTPRTTQEKDLILTVYFQASNSVLSSKTFDISTIYGCYPTIEPRYDDYNTLNIADCIESTPHERIRYGFRVYKTVFNKVDPLATDCFPLGYSKYNKVAKMRIYIQSTMALVFEGVCSYDYTTGIWTSIPVFGTGVVNVDVNASYEKFTYVLPNYESFLGEYMLAEFDFDIYYSATYYETVQVSSLNHILNYDNALTTPIIDYIKLIDPTTNAVISSIDSNIMTLNPTCKDYLKVEIKKLDAAEYNIIPVLFRDGTNIEFEYDPYTSIIMPQLTNAYFSSVPVDFGGTNIASFFLDTSTLDKTINWSFAVVIKKV